METLATLLTAVLKGMRLALGPYVNAAQTPVLRLAYDRIGRAATRFHSLFTRWQTNTLPTPRTRPAQSRQRAPKPYFPAGRAWLAGSTDHHVRGHASQLEHLLNHPDMPAFLTAAPQAGRILRPLCHMLGIHMPPPLLLSPRPPRGEPEGGSPPPPQTPQTQTPTPPPALPPTPPPPAPVHELQQKASPRLKRETHACNIPIS